MWELFLALETTAHWSSHRKKHLYWPALPTSNSTIRTSPGPLDRVKEEGLETEETSYNQKEGSQQRHPLSPASLAQPWTLNSKRFTGKHSTSGADHTGESRPDAADCLLQQAGPPLTKHGQQHKLTYQETESGQLGPKQVIKEKATSHSPGNTRSF